MTVESEVVPITYTGNSSTDTYSFTFHVLADADLLVEQISVAGVKSTLTLTTDYTVTNNGVSGGSITLTAGNLATGVKLTLTNNPDNTQPTDLKNQGAYYAETVETALDRRTLVESRTREQADRSIRIRAADASGVDCEINSTMAASKAVMTNSDGDGFILADPGSVALSTPGTDTVTTDTILNRAVTFAKMPAISQNQILGRISTSSGSIETLTPAQSRQIVGSTGWGISGLTLSNNGTDSDHDIDIASGFCLDDNRSVILNSSSTMVKQIDAAWAAGTNAGGMFTGSTLTANTVYAVWMIGETGASASEVDSVDFGFDESFTAPNPPSGYDYKRRIGWVVTDSSSNIRAFVQTGRHYDLVGNWQPVLDSTITDNTWEDSSAVGPHYARLLGAARVSYLTAGSGNHCGVHVRSKNYGVSVAAAQSMVVGVEMTSTEVEEVNGRFEVLLNSAGLFQYSATETAGTATVQIDVHTVEDLALEWGA